MPYKPIAAVLIVIAICTSWILHAAITEKSLCEISIKNGLWEVAALLSCDTVR
ncbi:Hok/Gef family protein [Rouxiella sp. WC2420]|uniref:Hok/Gef family protein n=1 Tax=Rouxiella sp. WC2420 TaxID=3234145 RepID=A0AB39VNM4_9GAMM